MEKLLVIGGIWALCAFCAVLFIRGATLPGRMRVPAPARAGGSDLRGLNAAHDAERG